MVINVCGHNIIVFIQIENFWFKNLVKILKKLDHDLNKEQAHFSKIDTNNVQNIFMLLIVNKFA